MRKLLFLGILVAAVVVAGILAFAALRGRLPSLSSGTGTVRVVASFYPIAEFARNVGGELVDVSTITPPGAEPHDYEPTPRQVAEIYGADLVLYNGNGMDAWAERLAPELRAQGVPSAMMSAAISGDAIGTDPHFWLDPNLAAAEVRLIRDTLSEIDPADAAAYARNASSYLSDLARLNADYASGLAWCEVRTVIASHSVFAYLSARYGFDAVAIAGMSPEQEPSAGRLSEIAALAKEKNVRAIFFETLASPKLSQTLANEIGAAALVFNPLEGLTSEESAAGETYLSVMRTNLENLKTGMVCP